MDKEAPLLRFDMVAEAMVAGSILGGAPPKYDDKIRGLLEAYAQHEMLSKGGC